MCSPVALCTGMLCIPMNNNSNVNDGAVQCRLSLERNRWLEANRQKEDQRREGSAILLNAPRCRQKLLNDSACAGAEGEGGHASKKRASCPTRDPIQDPVRSLKARSLSVVQVFPGAGAHLGPGF